LARDAAEARLQALSLRLQPLFLFNALNTISSTVYTDPVAADVMIGQLGDLLRQALRTADRPEIALAEDVEVLRAYLGLVEARFGNRLVCRLSIEPDALRCGVPAFLLQPLVENAVRHGSASLRGSVHVDVGASLAGNMLLLVIENDVASAPPPPRAGTGLSTTADRLRLLYGDAHRFTAGSELGRFRVRIELPARAAPAPASDLADDGSYASSHR
jgi:LytS/YehU family sensor histidine kinase